MNKNVKKRKEQDIICVEFEHDSSNFTAYGYPEKYVEYCHILAADVFEPAEIVELAVCVDYTVEQLIFTEDPVPIPIDLELYYNDFYEVIEIAKEKINNKYYDTLN